MEKRSEGRRKKKSKDSNGGGEEGGAKSELLRRPSIKKIKAFFNKDKESPPQSSSSSAKSSPPGVSPDDSPPNSESELASALAKLPKFEVVDPVRFRSDLSPPSSLSVPNSLDRKAARGDPDYANVGLFKAGAVFIDRTRVLAPTLTGQCLRREAF